MGVLTVLVAVEMPPPQLKVAPVVAELAVSVVLIVVHVSGTGGTILTFGGVMF